MAQMSWSQHKDDPNNLERYFSIVIHIQEGPVIYGASLNWYYNDRDGKYMIVACTNKEGTKIAGLHALHGLWGYLAAIEIDRQPTPQDAIDWLTAYEVKEITFS